MSGEELLKLLMFTTGASNPPIGGFQHLVPAVFGAFLTWVLCWLVFGSLFPSYWRKSFAILIYLFQLVESMFLLIIWIIVLFLRFLCILVEKSSKRSCSLRLQTLRGLVDLEFVDIEWFWSFCDFVKHNPLKKEFWLRNKTCNETSYRTKGEQNWAQGNMKNPSGIGMVSTVWFRAVTHLSRVCLSSAHSLTEVGYLIAMK